MFSSSTSNKAVLLRGIELLASNSPDSERQLLELLKNSKDVLRIDYSSLRNYVPPQDSSAMAPQHSSNPRQVSAPQQARNGVTAPSSSRRPMVEQPLPPKSKMMKQGNPLPTRNPAEPMPVRPTKPTGAPPPSAPLNNQQIPRPAYKQQPPAQNSSYLPSGPHYHSQQPTQPSQSPKTTKRDRSEDDFYTDENYKEPPHDGSSDDEQSEIFPVKKKRPRAVVY